jgi:hypothetical protein
MPMCPTHFKRRSQLGVNVQGSNRFGAQDARYPAMSLLYTQYSLQDTKMASGMEQGPTSWEVVLLSNMKTLKDHSI